MHKEKKCCTCSSLICIRTRTRNLRKEKKNAAYNRDGHQKLKLLLTDLSHIHLIGLAKRNILVFKSCKSDVSLQSYGLLECRIFI